MNDLKAIAESLVDNLAWDRCQCTKIHSAHRAEAEARVLALNVLHGPENAGPAHFYQCRPYGIWHWTQAPPRGTKDCTCGRRSYESQAVASKAAVRINKKIPADAPVRSLSYECPQGGHHTVIYPRGTPMRQCKCGHIGYRNAAAAETMLEHLQAKDSRGTVYAIYPCERETLHVAPSYKVPAWQIALPGNTRYLSHHYAPALRALGGPALLPTGWGEFRAGALAPLLRAATAELQANPAPYDQLVAEHTSHDTAEPLKIDLEHLAVDLAAHPDHQLVVC